jgi:hypothetical protein
VGDDLVVDGAVACQRPVQRDGSPGRSECALDRGAADLRDHFMDGIENRAVRSCRCHAGHGRRDSHPHAPAACAFITLVVNAQSGAVRFDEPSILPATEFLD